MIPSDVFKLHEAIYSDISDIIFDKYNLCTHNDRR